MSSNLGFSSGGGMVQQQSWPSPGFFESLNRLRQHFDEAVKSGKVLANDALSTIKLLEDAGNGKVPIDQIRTYVDMLNRLQSGQTVSQQEVEQLWSWGGVWDGVKKGAKWAWENKETIYEVGKTAAELLETGPQQQSISPGGAEQQSLFGPPRYAAPGWWSKWIKDRPYTPSPTVPLLMEAGTGGTAQQQSFPPSPSFLAKMNLLRQQLDQAVKQGKILADDALSTIMLLEDAGNGKVPLDQIKVYLNMLNRLQSGQPISQQEVEQLWSLGGAWNSVKKAATAAGKFVYENRETIGTAASIAVMLLEQGGAASSPSQLQEGLYYIRKAS
jgi:hypothetical protein